MPNIKKERNKEQEQVIIIIIIIYFIFFIKFQSTASIIDDYIFYH